MKITHKTLEIMPKGYHKDVRHNKSPVCTGKNAWAWTWRPKRVFADAEEVVSANESWTDVIEKIDGGRSPHKTDTKTGPDNEVLGCSE